MNTQKKRRIVLIDHRFQLRMAASFIVLQILLTGLFAFALYLFMDSEIHADLASAHASYQSLSQMLLPIVVILAVFSVTLSVVLATVFVVLLSHKIAGPMYRFRNVLEALSSRRIETFRNIRPDDQLGELAGSLDRAVQTVNQDIESMQRACERLLDKEVRRDERQLDEAITGLAAVLVAWQVNAGAQSVSGDTTRTATHP
ncbi:MAG: hypothetical protein PHF20_09625 [Halothiobacillaceae bacterium]|nr:hypothetical protein [Halothiobacillaceae bacterium]